MSDRVSPEEAHDWRRDRHCLDATVSFDDLMMVVGGVIFCVTIVLVVGLSALRSDRPAACAPYPTYAECAAAVAEGSDQ